LHAVLENITDGIVACDAEGVLTLFNRATRDFHGLPVEQLPSEEWAERYDLFCPTVKRLCSRNRCRFTARFEAKLFTMRR
jgi:PAS domain-containing protein